MLNKIVEEIFDKLLQLNEKNNFNDLIYHCKTKQRSGKSFNDFDNAICMLEKIRGGKMALGEVRKIKSDLNQI